MDDCYSYDSVGMAELWVHSTDQSVIVLDVKNEGVPSDWQHRLPSLPQDALREIERSTFLTFRSWREAVTAFERLTLECAAAGPCTTLTGSITLVCRPFRSDDGCETQRWDLDANTRPVFRNADWTHEDIPGRG